MAGTARPSALLTPDEIALLSHALSEWGGPARPNDALARAMGFGDAAGLPAACDALDDELRRDAPLASEDWARILVSTEIVFASDLYGSGVDWPTTTGRSDADTIALLRSIQVKLDDVLEGQYGNVTTP